MKRVQIWVDARSTNCFKVAWAACRLGVDTSVDWRSIDLARHEQRRPEFLALNPLGQVPLLSEDDRTLPESEAILDWLWDRTVPGGQRSNPWAQRWRSWNQTALAPAVRAIAWERLFKPMLGHGSADAAALERALPVLDACLGHLDRHVRDDDALEVSRCGPAAISIRSVLRLVRASNVDLSRFATLHDWDAELGITRHYQRAERLLGDLNTQDRGD